MRIRWSSGHSKNKSYYFPHGADTRMIPKTVDEQRYIQKQRVISPTNSKVLTIAIIGLPNSGKSTLTNQLMDWRVCSVSKKIHTTKTNSKSAYIDGDVQMIFLDTPGLINKAEQNKFHLKESALTGPENSLADADVVLLVFDITHRSQRHEFHPKIMRLLKQNPNKPTVLVLNKVDMLKSKSYLIDIVNSLTKGYLQNEKAFTEIKVPSQPKTGEAIMNDTLKWMQQPDCKLRPKVEDVMLEDLEVGVSNLDTTKLSTHWPLFKDIFMISALHNDGVDNLRDYLLKHAKPASWKHPRIFVTDEDPKKIVIKTVREKLLNRFQKEIPYILHVRLVNYDLLDTGILSIGVDVHCPQSNLIKMVIGPRGQTVMEIAEEAKKDLMNTFRCGVSLKLGVQILIPPKVPLLN